MKIPSTKLLYMIYNLCVAVIYMTTLGIICLIIYVVSNEFKIASKKNTILFLLSITLLFNIFMLLYNRYESVYYEEYYIVRKEVINDSYYIFTDNDLMIKCSQKIYNKVSPHKEYLLTYQENKLKLFYRDIIIDIREAD